ncbi:drug resistance MFS transporter, drug:H+ antiporter-1 (DHA2) family protein [Klebsiella michiganensis]|uniref:Drug resistance MFS transporter, drug:H+ antiporter-1 (DHA2) family protein n=1 Tax=Klebsiella michiganensis TaxID=1134687 RepID=A0A7H4N278_9ENTR|nr:drug resistance MFS transporter, drug:H+ antiporter-1 (DHA2) family protein [Klebsiella michiganensis]
MNINQDKRVKETTHPRPINAIPPTLWMQAAIITLGAFATMLSSTMLSAALPAMAAGLWRDGHGNTMDSNGVSYGPCGRRSA